MAYRFSLAFLTTAELPIVENIKVAAEAGYDHVGLRLLPAAADGPYPLLTDTLLLKEVKAAMADTGISVADIEIVRLGENFQLENHKQFLEKGAELGAKNILVAGDDNNIERMIQNYGKFCELALQYNMTADLEFMPWTAIPDLATALKIAQATNFNNVGILVDAIHLERSTSTFEEVAALNNKYINYAQICDVANIKNPTNEQMIFAAREARLNPGEGDIDFTKLISALPKDIVLSIEVPNLQRAKTVPALQRAKDALVATKSFI